MKTKTAKKIISMLLALAMLFSVTAVATSAEGSAQPLFTLTDVQTRQGEEFDVTIKFARDSSPNNDPIAALDVSLKFNSAAFTVIDYYQGNGLINAFKKLENDKQLGLDGGDYIYKTSKNTPGEIKWSLVTLKGFTFKNGEDFMVVRFKANDKFNISSKLDMTVEVTNAAGPDFTDKTASYPSYTNDMDVELNLTTLCNWSYDAATKSYTLLKFNDVNATQFTIPDEYEDPTTSYGSCPVTKINTAAFIESPNIEKIVLGKNIKAVGSAAFYGCSKLSRIVVFNKDTVFGANALYGASDGLVVKCYEGSTADNYVKNDTYAKANGYVAEYFEDVADCTIKGADEVLHYTGSPIVLSGLELYNSKGVQLVKGTDYTVEYENNTDIGTAKLTITGRGEYLGQKTLEFEILCPYHNSESGYYTETKFYADCELGGKVIKDCTFCKYHDESETLPAKEHGEAEWKTITEATCANEGLDALVCPDCGKHLDEKILNKLEHAELEWIVTTPATCTQDGVESYTCKECNEVLETRPIKSPGHTKSETWTVTKEATCTEKGTESLLCTVCQEVLETREIEAKGHAPSESWTVIKEATCTEKGTESLLCTVCQEVLETREIEAKGHTPSESWTVIKEATCTEKGTESLLCKNCNEVLETREIEAKGHTPSESWTVIKEATCTEKGTESLLCKNCNEVLDTREIEAKGHTPSESWTVIKEATCTEKGTESLLCTVCQEVLETREIEAKGHTPSESWAVIKAATCTEKGTESLLCKNCNEVLETRETPALGHASGEWVVKDGNQPTCTQPGHKDHLCSRCGKSYETKEIPATGHTPGEWETIIEPNCTQDGMKQKECTVCHQAAETQVIPAKGHKPVFVVVTLPTYKFTGLEKQVCSVCHQDLGRTRAIAKIYPDVNADTKVNSSDALLVLQHATGIKILTGTNLKNADTNGDAKVNSTDALIILQIATGIIKI